MLIRYTINKKFETFTGQTVTVSSVSADTVNSKYINIPINMESIPFDYTEDISKVVLQEREKAIYKKNKNKPFDAETIKYTFKDNTANSNMGLLLEFRFWDDATKTYSTSYQNAGITSTDIRDNSNAFKNSFFKLNFRNSNSGETNTTIFSEYINVFDTKEPKFYFNKLYWLRNDDFFINNNLNRIVYMDAKFFNAKTGKIHNFINIPLSIQTNNLPISIESYSEPNNRDWRSSAIEIVNPRFNNGVYNFRTVSPFGANTLTKITMSEFILK